MVCYRRGLIVVVAIAMLGCPADRRRPTLYAPRLVRPTGATVSRTDVDVDCLWAGHRVLCTLLTDHTLVNRTEEPTTAAIVVASKETGARSLYLDGKPVEPFSHDANTEIDVALSPGQTRHLVVQTEIGIHRTLMGGSFGGSEDQPSTTWMWIHPHFASDQDVWEYWPVHYCFVPDRSNPSEPVLRRLQLPHGLHAAQEWDIDSAGDACPELPASSSARAATLEVQRSVPFIKNGGPVVSAGYSFGEGWVAELAYDLGVWRYFDLQLGVHADLHHELQINPMFGLPLLLKVGLPVRVEPREKVGFRVEESFYFRRENWPVAVSPVLYLEAWHDDGVRVGLLGSVSF